MKWIKVLIGVIVLSVAGGAGIAVGMNMKEERTVVYSDPAETISAPEAKKEEPVASYTVNKEGGQSKTANPVIRETEGKVTALDKQSITVSFPFGGSETFKLTNQTVVEDFSLPLKKGVLVELKASGEEAVKIETERTMDVKAVIVSDEKESMKVEANGTTKSFTKGRFYRLDRDGYRGSIKGVPVELDLDEHDKILSAELDDEFLDGYDD
ncbi:DUF5666 domain-containing protein [Heyndrickxia coagulans]|uniref:DUF5666 domain-containing protein n=1 Tax=Heyndrickxia coagulans TaxID=1398 RepID=UPI000416576A|nr:DUF5666 domain-containing protein [Heyndrickxia coagulans]